MVREAERADVIYDEVQEQQGAPEERRERPWKRYLEAELGLRNHWYPAFFSNELKEGETRHEMVLGERIYFKRVRGRVFAVEDRCPHRAASFSSRVECYTANTITCPVHGFTYDIRDGKLVSILTENDSALVGKLSVPPYPVEEKFSLVWVYIGDGEPRALREDVLPTLWNTPDLVMLPTTRYKIRANWRVAIENGYDTGHLYGHRNWASAWRYGAVLPIGTVNKTKDDIVLLEEPGAPVGMHVKSSVNTWVGEVEGVKVHMNMLDLNNVPPKEGGLYPPGFGPFLPCGLDVPGFPRPGLYHWEWYVPVDEEHHMYTILQGTQARTEEERENFYREHEEYLARDVWVDPGTARAMEPPGFNNFDSFGREVMQHAYKNEDWWHRERLYKADYTIIQWRNLVSRHADVVQTRAARGFAKPDSLTRSYPENPIP